MTSKQAKLIVGLLILSGCGLFEKRGAPPLTSPYPTRHVWAVVPLRNESGNSQANGFVLADHLVNQLENATNLDLLPVNRTLRAMEKLEMDSISSPREAMRLLNALGIDGLVVGTITAYDPYDPPKLGIAIELYVHRKVDDFDAQKVWLESPLSIESGTGPSLAGLQRLSWSATGSTPIPKRDELLQPASVVSAFFDGATPDVLTGIEQYAHERSRQLEPQHLYRISMDLYSEFVCYVMSWRLLNTEAKRVAELTTTTPAP